MAKNDFKPFAIGEFSNVVSQEEYEALPAVGAGFNTGIARSEQLNKVWRQPSVMASVLGDFIAEESLNDVLDDGDLVKLKKSLTDALFNYSTRKLDNRYLSLAGGTLTGQLQINHADFINKNGYTTYNDVDGNLHHQSGGLRLTIADTILAELYFNETAGKSAEVSLHNKYGSTDSYFSLRNDGLISISGTNPRINFNNGTVYASDGNVNGSVWGGYLSNYITKAVNGRVDWDTFNREVGSRATVDWVNANFARKVPDYLEIGSYIYARSDTNSDISPNTIVSGSTLHAATGDGAIIGDALPGSWRSMGYSTRTNDAHRATLWIRVS